MKFRLLLSIIALLAVNEAFSQTAQDALRYSRIFPGGTARFMGLGGAYGAIGADFTTSSLNPAGIGLYKLSEFTITPAVFTQKTNSHYNGRYADDIKSNFYLGDVGIVITSPAKNKKSPWKYFQFSTGLNRLADFNNRMYMTGPNGTNSLLDTYLGEAQGPPRLSFETIENDYSYAFDLNLAWWTYLLDYSGDSLNYAYFTPIPDGNVLQTKTVETTGSMNEYVFSFATNYNDRLFLGMTFGLPMIRYYESSTYKEDDYTTTIYDFNSFSRHEYLETHGSGFNFKLGFIYRVSDWLRVGGAYHTPTWYGNMRDYWYAEMSSRFDNGDTYQKASPSGNYDYELTTPMRVIAGATVLFGENGLISADYEFADYSSARLDAFDYNFRQENEDISENYSAGHNVRVGTEWRYQIFNVRAGYNWASSPYATSINDGTRNSFSAGIGIREKYFFLDLAYVYSKTTEDYYFYNSQYAVPNPVNNDRISHSVLLTLGGRF